MSSRWQHLAELRSQVAYLRPRADAAVASSHATVALSGGRGAPHFDAVAAAKAGAAVDEVRRRLLPGIHSLRAGNLERRGALALRQKALREVRAS